MSPVSFRHVASPMRVAFGWGTHRDHLVEELAHVGASRVLLLATGSQREVAGALVAEPDVPIVAVADGVTAHVPRRSVAAVASLSRERHVDALVAVGGGSAIGLAKAVAREHPVPVIAVPTTYSGLELLPTWTVRDEHVDRSTGGRDPLVLPRSVVYDPQLTMSLPIGMTQLSALNALGRAVEAFWLPGVTNPLSVLVASAAVDSLVAGMRRIAEDPADRDARELLLYGAWLSGVASGSARPGLYHELGRVMDAHLDVSYAALHAVLLPYVLAFQEPASMSAALRLARCVEPTGDGDTRPSHLLRLLQEHVGVPTSLREIGVTKAQLKRVTPVVVQAVTGSRELVTPRSVTEHDVEDVLMRAWLAGELVA